MGPLWISVINVATISCNDCLQPLPEGTAPIVDHSLIHTIPGLVNRLLQGLNIGVADVAGHWLNVRPESEVKRVEVWTVWGPQILWPKGQLVAQEALGDIGSVGRGSILLKDHIAIWKVFLDPWDKLSGQLVDVVSRSESVACREPDQGHYNSTGGNKSKAH